MQKKENVAVQLGAVLFRRRFLFFLNFSSYEEKTMKQAIPWMPLSANLLKPEYSILPRAKRATNRNNVATEQRIYKKKILAPNSPGAEMSSAETMTPNRRRRNVPDPRILVYWHTFLTLFWQG